MVLKTNKLKSGILLGFLMIMVFSLSLSYFNNTVSSSWAKGIVNGIYFLKKILFVLCILIIILNRRVKTYSVVLCFAAFILWMITAVFFPENIPYVEKIGIDIICALTSFVVISSGSVDYEKFIEILVVISRVLIVIALVSLTMVDNLAHYMSYSYMVFSNAIMVPIAMVIYNAVTNSRILDYWLGFGGLLFILFLGSRGSFFALGLMAVFLLFIKSKETKQLYGLILIPVVVVVMYFISNSEILGIETSRILQKISSGTLFSSNDRLEIWKYLLACCANDGFWGHGICADRYYLPLRFTGSNATYAHNMFVEVLVDFGLIGLIILIGFVILLFKYFYREMDDQYKLIVVTFFFVSFFQLMYSRSFLTEANLFIMYGFIFMRMKKIELNRVE